MLTVGARTDSGGNAPVNCRSAEIRFEGRLTDPANSPFRPSAAGQDFPSNVGNAAVAATDSKRSSTVLEP